MLKPLKSLGIRQLRAKQYIADAIKKNSDELAFTHPYSNGENHPIINEKIIYYLIKQNFNKNIIVSLNLSKCDLNDQSIIHLSAGSWKALLKLSLYRNYLTIRCFLPLSRGNWKDLRNIDLSQNNFSNPKGQQLALCKWKNLSILDLSRVQVRPIFFKSILKNLWNNLINLNIGKNLLSNCCMEYLVAFQCSFLQRLNLQENNLTNDSMIVLVKGSWKKLSFLNLNNNFIKAEGMQHLSTNKWNKKIQILIIQNLDYYLTNLSYDMMSVENKFKCFYLFKYWQKSIEIKLNQVFTEPNILKCQQEAFTIRQIVYLM